MTLLQQTNLHVLFQLKALLSYISSEAYQLHRPYCMAAVWGNTSGIRRSFGVLSTSIGTDPALPPNFGVVYSTVKYPKWQNV